MGLAESEWRCCTIAARTIHATSLSNIRGLGFGFRVKRNPQPFKMRVCGCKCTARRIHATSLLYIQRLGVGFWVWRNY